MSVSLYLQTIAQSCYPSDYDQTDYTANIALANKIANKMTNELLPMIESIAPNGSAYMNKCDFEQPNFQQLLYGVNYESLLKVKDKYDPDQIFFAITAVGSERWYQDEKRGGRLSPT
jgi:hypothetical protein